MAYQLTSIDVAAMRKADGLTVHFNGSDESNNGICAVLRRERTEKDPFAEDSRHNINAPITCRAYSLYNSLSGYVRPDDLLRVKCFAHISLFHSQHTPASTIVQMLKAGDEIAVEFVGNTHTTDAMKMRSQFFGDECVLHVMRGKKHFEFVLHYSICEDNSARMVRGLPSMCRENIAA